MPLQPKLLLLLVIASTLLFGGCAKKATTEPGLAKVDYWKPMSSYLAGNYSAMCMGNPAETNVNIVIGADGKYTFGQYAGDLHTSTELVFSRKRQWDGSVGLFLHAEWDDGVLNLATGNGGQGSVASFGKGGTNVFVCSPSKWTIGLAAKPLHVVFASLLDAAPRQISCIRAADMKMTKLSYQFKDGVVQIGEYKYIVSKMNASIRVDGQFSSLSYIAGSDDDGSISVGLDQHGKVLTVMAQSKDGPLLTCNKA